MAILVLLLLLLLLLVLLLLLLLLLLPPPPRHSFGVDALLLLLLLLLARVIGGKLSANARDDAREYKCYFVNSALEPDSRLLSITRACVEAWQCTHAHMSMCPVPVVLVGG